MAKENIFTLYGQSDQLYRAIITSYPFSDLSVKFFPDYENFGIRTKLHTDYIWFENNVLEPYSQQHFLTIDAYLQDRILAHERAILRLAVSDWKDVKHPTLSKEWDIPFDRFWRQVYYGYPYAPLRECIHDIHNRPDLLTIRKIGTEDHENCRLIHYLGKPYILTSIEWQDVARNICNFVGAEVRKCLHYQKGWNPETPHLFNRHRVQKPDSSRHELTTKTMFVGNEIVNVPFVEEKIELFGAFIFEPI